VGDEQRVGWQPDLAQIDAKLVQLLALVVEALAAATDALLSGDTDVAEVLSKREELVGDVYGDVERLMNRVVTLSEVPREGELAFLLAALRVVAELERGHELAEHIARRAAYGLAAELTPRARGLIDRMGKVGVGMWRKAADCWYERDTHATEEISERDEEMDELHGALVSEVAGAGVRSAVAMELALVARFYERLGDHAVNVARFVAHLSGEAERAEDSAK
jgi:phosphate transport system protein